jgi:selenocysteine-specific elongation factor
VRTVATAGHVDHGKSSLVLALTGTDPDRFPEEKTRGLTIDLGFAFTTLPSGARIGFVDVPGHVKFIKNMLAGVGAVEVALFVVAASEGWMPQSEEHLRILELLGVRHGVVAITKTGLVDEDTLELARLEVGERLGASVLAGAPVVTCDSIAGVGLDDVRGALDTVLTAAPAARDLGRPRLWIDRVFTAKGAGTVVTGTLTGGALAIGDDVHAGDHPGRVRGIETAGDGVERVEPGARVALNLAGIEHRALARGDAVVRPGQWADAVVVDAALHVLPDEQLRRRGRYQAYVGSGEHRVWLRTLDPDSRYARLRFDAPVPLAPGDRLVLRDPGRRHTVAGLEVLDVTPVRRAKDAPDRLAQPLGLRLLAASPWLALGAISTLAGLSEHDAAALADDLVASGAAARVDEWLVATRTLEQVREESARRATEHHRRHPHDAGIDAAALAASLGTTAEQLRAALAGAPDVLVEHGVVRHASHAATVTDSAEAQRVLDAIDAAPFSPPSPLELGVDRALVRALVREGRLVEIDGVVFSAAALERARALVIDALRARERVTVADVRDLLGSTRKYVVPLVGWLDRQGVTRRRGDDRVPGPASGLTELGSGSA